jgi:hypothetical protein
MRFGDEKSSMRYLIMIILGIPLCLGAQSGVHKKAERLMAAYDLQGAIQLLEGEMSKGVTPASAALLGECYRLSGRFEDAERNFRLVRDWGLVEPKYHFQYARTLQRNEQYADAQTQYRRYLEKNAGDLVAQRQAQACAQIRDYQNRGLGWWEAQPLFLNSGYREFSPAIFENQLVFSSDRPKDGKIKAKDAWTGEGYLNLFKSTRKTLDASQCGSYSYGPPEIFDEGLSSPHHEASAHFSSNAREVFFTTNSPGGSQKNKKSASLLRLQIRHAQLLTGGRGWSEPMSLPFNSQDYSVMHPCLSADGNRLYFASDKEGGYGGLDLYYSERTGPDWGRPVNLGPRVNTPGSEAFPYVDSDGVLYFSSDGWPGLGGLDIFIFDGKGEAPYNPGYPVNSSADDFGFIWQEKGLCGYFSSDRPGGAGKDDIYVFRRIAHPIEVEVVDAHTGLPLGGAVLEADCLVDSLGIKDGHSRWELPHNACCNLQAAHPGYQTLPVSRCTHNLPPGEPLRLSLSLTPLPVYTIEGAVMQKDSYAPLEGALIQVVDQKTERVAYRFRTGADGRFEIGLEGGACYLIRVSRSAYANFQTQGPCVPLEGASQRFPYKIFLERN